jgi:glycosyltransferase involved in cell wall biosynthesis
MLETRIDHVFETGRTVASSQKRHAADSASHEPLIAVVIPAYKQPGYLQDAVLSVLKQTMRPFVRTVIVSDGCPYPSTDELARLFSSQFPGEVFYLKKDNGGLSSARNHGIRFALDAWPSIQAILPLDADNRMAPHTIERLWQSLVEAADDTGWVYHDLTIFGTEESAWRTGIPFSVYRLLHENFCDAGSLVHRRLFDSNIWYDESMKIGYEDWELYIRAALSGLRGVHASDTGFLYRVHGHSMLTNTQQQHRNVYDAIVRKHARQLRPANLVRLEHDELPRYAIVEMDADRVRWTTNPCDTDQSTMSIAAFLDAMAGWECERRPKSRYVPPMTIFSTEDVLERLRRLRILPGTLFGLQALSARCDSAFLNFQVAESPYVLGLSRADSPSRPALLAIPSRRLIEVASQQKTRMPHLIRGTDGFSRAGFSLQIGLAHTVHVDGLRHDQLAGRPEAEVTVPAIKVMDELSTRLRASSAATLPRMHGDDDKFMASHTYFAAQQQLDKGTAIFPYFARTQG